MDRSKASGEYYREGNDIIFVAEHLVPRQLISDKGASSMIVEYVSGARILGLSKLSLLWHTCKLTSRSR